MAAGLAAGPWPSLGPGALLWRIPLLVCAAALSVRCGAGRLVRAIAVAAGLVLIADATIPAHRSAPEAARQLASQVVIVRDALSAASQDERVRELLSPTGTEAEPEAAFRLVAELARGFPVAVDTFVVVDDSGLPVAWAGTRPRVPIRLRTLGERMVATERGVHETWLWWREAVFEAGRPLGGVLTAVSFPDDGLRRPLGVWAGRAALIRPTERGGVAVDHTGGPVTLAITVASAPPLPVSLPGLALAAIVALLAWRSRGLSRGLFAAAATAPGLLLAWGERGWWLAVAWAAAAAVLAWATSGSVRRLAVACCVGATGVMLPGIIDWLQIQTLPEHLAWPGALRWALVLGLASLFRVAGGGRARPIWFTALAWLPLVIGLWRADPVWLGAGAALVALAGLPSGRSTLLPAAAAAALLLGGDAAARRVNLVAITETTLARLDGQDATARRVLDAEPGPGTGAFATAETAERLLMLGRLAERMRLNEVLPGCALALADPSGTVAATWGDTPLKVEGRPRELVIRRGTDGWSLAIVAPLEPHDVLSALRAAGITSPVAVLDRSGSPASRGATFRPLSPAAVGAALAGERSWGKIGVGDREFRAYLRARHDVIIAVPWVRPPEAENALQMAAVTIWGVFPVGLWQRRRRFRRWWQERHTFPGRVRVLVAVSTLLPVLVLGQFLPRQWERQREQARLELGRAVSRSLAAAGWEEGLVWLVREMGGTVAVYRRGPLAETTRPDLAALGQIPLLPPAEAYARAVRGWREPLVVGGEFADVFAPLRRGDEPIVLGMIGLHVLADGPSPSPGEWFLVTGIAALLAALATAERLSLRLTRPLRRLVGAARRIERGESLLPIAAAHDEDVAALGGAFVTMAASVRRREEDIRRERDLLDQVLATLSAGVIVADSTGRVELANPAAHSLLTSGENVGELMDFFGPVIDPARSRTSGAGLEEVVRPKARPEALWRISVQPLAFPDGRELIVLEDLSELARAERLSSLADLARIVAHEVKNPLTPIRLWAEELQASLERSPADVVAVARLASGQILERVVHLREVAQGFSNLVALEHWEGVPLDLLAIAREVAHEYAVLSQRGITVSVAGSPAWCRADAQWIRRALRHLFENSARVLATASGTIAVTVGRESDFAVLAVADSGGGVAEEVLGRLFEPHFSTTTQGSGLGLAVVRRVAERAGGRAEATNRGGGLEVRLVLPAIADQGVC